MRAALKADAPAGAPRRPGASLRTVTAVDQHQKLYAVSKIAVVVNSLRREGIPASRALRGAQIAEPDLHRSATRVSLNQIIRTCRNAAELSRDPHFAFHAGMRVHLSTYGMYGFAILSSNSFREAMVFALKYHQLAIPLVDIEWREERGRSVWTLHPIETLHLDTSLLRFVFELELAIVLSLHRDCIDRSLSPLQALLPFPVPHDAAVYSHMFGCRAVFGQAHASLIFDSQWLDGEPLFRNELAYSELVTLCDDLLREFRFRIGITGRVREVLLVNRMWPIGMGEVAKQLHMTERTLRRRLQEENRSFQRVLAELRMRMAIKYLRETDLSIAEIAHSLGFGEDASFRQAFRRWSKVAPRQFKTRLRERSQSLSHSP